MRCLCSLLTEVCDEIIYWLLIILSFLNLKCLRPLFIMLAFYVSFMGVSYFWNLFLMTMCWRISISRYWADFTFFWWKFLAVLKTLVWCLLLRSGLNIFVLQARNEFTHSFGFWFWISFLNCNLLPFELFFLFIVFCILILFWIWLSIWFLMVVLMHSWVVSDDLLFYAISFVWRCFDHLFRFYCWFQNDFFPKVSLLPHDDLDPTLSCDDTFIWIFELPQILFLVWLKFYVLVARSVLEVLFLCLQIYLFYCRHVLLWGASVHF